MIDKTIKEVLKIQESEINSVWNSLHRQKAEIEEKILLTKGAHLMLQTIKDDVKKAEKKHKKTLSKNGKES